MTRDFDHVIVTRFSVRYTADQPAPDDQWLQYRWPFFRDVTIPSFASQTQQGFRWLVFFDRDCPSWLRDDVSAVAPGLFTPVWLDGPGTLGRVAAEISSDAPYLITTRVDSDDAIARSFVADVWSHFDHQDALYINFLRGLQIDRKGWVYGYGYLNNAFLSYVEKRQPGVRPVTVLRSAHGDCRRFAPVLNVVGPPRWLQVIHGSNVDNNVRGTRVDPSIVAREFEIDLPYLLDVPARQVLAQNVLGRAGLVRDWVSRPALIRQYASGKVAAVRGTRIWPQKS